mmetsp:Transcript_6756/g.18860  ORF Transcript_6756/g.18860 Transcript_6756/m.18860 type:complete len:246 (+) Transcript_6756:243-980(+)
MAIEPGRDCCRVAGRSYISTLGVGMGIRGSETTVAIVEPIEKSINHSIPLDISFSSKPIDLNSAPFGSWKEEHVVCFDVATGSSGTADGRPRLPRQRHHRIDGVLRAPNDVPMCHCLRRSGGGPSAGVGTAGVLDDDVSLPEVIVTDGETIDCKAIKDAESAEIVKINPFPAKVSSVGTISVASVFQRRSRKGTQCNVGLPLSSQVVGIAAGVVRDGFVGSGGGKCSNHVEGLWWGCREWVPFAE